MNYNTIFIIACASTLYSVIVAYCAIITLKPCISCIFNNFSSLFRSGCPSYWMVDQCLDRIT